MSAYYNGSSWQSDTDIERKRYERIYSISRHGIFVIAVFTMINFIIKLKTYGDCFIFSAYIPYVLLEYGMLYSGVFPEGFDPGGLTRMEKYDTSFFSIMMLVAVMIVSLYVYCWSYSKKNKGGFMITALVMFSVDTLAYFISNGVSLEHITDIIFRTVILVGLVAGVVVYFRMKELPVKSLHRE